MKKLTDMLKKEQEKLKAQSAQEEEKMKSKEEKLKKQAAQKKTVAKADEGLKELADQAAAGTEKIPPGKPCLENLSEQAKAAVALAAAVPFVCSRCRYRGCLSCDEDKALQYWLKKKGFVQQTMELKAVVLEG